MITSLDPVAGGFLAGGAPPKRFTYLDASQLLPWQP